MLDPSSSRFVRMIVEAGRKNIPLDVSLELTHHCNFRCQHCYIPDFSAPDQLSTERVLRLLDELVEMGTLYLTLTGGELFLRKDWYTIARRARELGFRLRLFSNASLIDEEIADRIVTLHCPVEISLYSVDEEVFERVTQRKGSFRKTIRGIELLREREVEVLLKVPMMTINYQGVEEVFDYARRIGAECRADSKIVGKKDGDVVTIGLRVSEEDLLPFYRGPHHTACSIPDEYSDDPEKEGPMCAAANRFCSITSSGDVMACTILPGSDGNIRERSFRDVWENSEWLNKIRAIRRKDIAVCNSCPKHSYCGRCHAQALVEDGDLMGPSSWACNHAETLERAFGKEPAPKAASAGRRD